MTCVKLTFQPMFAVFFCGYRIAYVWTVGGYLLYSILPAAKMLSARMGSFVQRLTPLNREYFQNCLLGIFLMILQAFSKMMYGNSNAVTMRVFLGCLNADYTVLRRYICLKDVFLFLKEWSWAQLLTFMSSWIVLVICCPRCYPYLDSPWTKPIQVHIQCSNCWGSSQIQIKEIKDDPISAVCGHKLQTSWSFSVSSQMLLTWIASYPHAKGYFPLDFLCSCSIVLGVVGLLAILWCPGDPKIWSCFPLKCQQCYQLNGSFIG